jgi:uncharacterized SAM-binding protein YcdF (DUF218 family)
MTQNRGRRGFLRGLLVTAGLAIVAALGWVGFVYAQVARQAGVDEAQPADAIVVLGAAQYWGRPSPVLKARLDHALELYNRGLAPRIITTGGHGPDAKFSEGQVSREYLSENGVPAEFITVEDAGLTTMQSAAAVAEIMDRMELRSCIVVSDDYHMLRAKRMLQERGLAVYGSPRRSPQSADPWPMRKRLLREAVSYSLWRVGIRL